MNVQNFVWGVVISNFQVTMATSWMSKVRTFITYSIGYECSKLRNFNDEFRRILWP
jgi:hypothetical protein